VAPPSIEAGRLALLSYLEPFGLDDRTISRIEVILEELVSNIVRHAADADTIGLEACCSDCTLQLVILDNGKAFNPLEAKEPERYTSLESATLGGQGIPLIKKLSQSVAYERVDGENRVCAVIAVKPQAT